MLSSLQHALRIQRATRDLFMQYDSSYITTASSAAGCRAVRVKPGRSVHKVVDAEPMRILRYS